MRLGCFGCLVLILVIFIVLLTVAGVLFLSANVFGVPDVQPVAFSRGDGYAAQQKLYEIVLRQAGRSSRQDPLVLTEREANAFLARHLTESAGLPLNPLSVRFARGQILVQGRAPLRNLLQGPPFAQVIPYVRDKRLDQPVWVTVRGRISVESSLAGTSSRYGKVEVTEFVLGRQPTSGFLLYVMMGPSGAAMLRWPVPAVVSSIEVEEQQLIIRTR